MPVMRLGAAAGEAWRLLRYALVGAVATAAHYAVLVMAVELAHWPAWLGSGLGAVLGAQLAYVGNRCFTFAHRGRHLVSWTRFQLTAAAAGLLGMALVALAVQIGLHYLVGQLLATLTAMLLSYALNRRWAFAATPGRE